MHAIPAVLFVLTGSVAAQASGGVVFALPHGFSIDPGTPLPGVGPGVLLYSDTGIDGASPLAGPPAGTPDFATFLGGAPVDVDAFSLGHDWVVGNSIGEAIVDPGSWAAITFSVTRATTGAAGGVIAAAVAEPDGAAADTFAYVIPGSTLPPVFVGIPIRAQDATEIPLPPSAGVKANVDAHDLYVALLYLENPQLGALLPPPTVYFSVTAATAGAIPAAWAPPALRTGGTVFATTWSPLSSGWSTPAPALTTTSLGLLPGEDVDALALDVAHGRVLFSTTTASAPPAGPRDPLLFSVLGSAVHHAYRLPGGTPISAEVALGLAPDDIDGICALDPGTTGSPSQARLPFQLGTPAPPLPTGLPTLLQAVVWRGRDHPTNAEFAETWMTGWPPPGAPQPSLAIVGASVGGSAGPYVVVGVFVRPQPGTVFPGHPESHRIMIPAALSLSGLPLHFLWGALSPTTFDVSHPVGILL